MNSVGYKPRTQPNLRTNFDCGWLFI